jgi:Amidohydrolase family
LIRVCKFLTSMMFAVFITAGISVSVQAQDFDVVILNGRVIDPASGLDATRNIGIRGNKIAAISEFPLKGKVEIAAGGLIVSPGFIDLHAHGQNIGDYRMQVMQGVTTALELESGVLPVGDWYKDQAKKKLPINYGTSAAWVFGRIAAFTNTDPLATAAYFQDAQSRNDWKMKISTPDQSKTIMSLVEKGLKEGALGIGINAGYAPGYGQKEYFALAELAKTYNVPTYTHVRYASNIEPKSSFEALKELIANAAITGAHMHICHINSVSLSDIKATLALVDQAQAKGVNITVEAYPYGAGNTVIGAAIFSGPDWRQRMSSTANNFQLGSDRLTEAQLKDYQTNKPGTFVTWHFLDEKNPQDLAKLDLSVTHPSVMIASDSVFWSYFDDKGGIQNYAGDEWPMPKKVFTHPRAAGTFAKVLRSYVRERGLLSLSEAIKKMSLMPAQALEKSVPQMRQKGRLQIGMDADIVVFDAKTITDHATYENANQPATGVLAVLVNGVSVVRKGELILDAAPGQPIRREIAE